MKKVIAVLMLACFPFVMVSCQTIKIETKGGYAYLAPDNGGKPVAKTVRSKMVFYALWGLVNITDNSTKDMIKPKEIVRVKTYLSVIDVLITGFLSIVSVGAYTVDVEVIR